MASNPANKVDTAVLDPKLPGTSHFSYFINMLIRILSNHLAGRGKPPVPALQLRLVGLCAPQPGE